jgi:uncharacterized membrane protein YheB (UPF0754 family)
MTFDLLIKYSPLILSTLHGYLAARLTLWLIFHPRRPLRLFGRRLPFTPGLVPRQRQVFIAGFANIVAERLLNIEAIGEEILRIDLKPEIGAYARSEYLHHSQQASTQAIIVDHLRERLYHLRDSVETRWEIARALRSIIEAEFEKSLGAMRRLVTAYFLDDELIYRLIGRSIDQLAESIAESIYVRSTIEQTLSQVPESIFQQVGGGSQSKAIRSLVESLSEKLDLRELIVRRFEALTGEEIETIIRQGAAREIRGLIRLGTVGGLLVGAVQTLLNLLV